MSKKTTITGGRPTMEEIQTTREAMESPEFLNSQAKAIEGFDMDSKKTLSRTNIDLMEQAHQLENRFWKTVRINDSNKVVEDLLSIAKELGENPELQKYCTGHKLADILRLAILQKTIAAVNEGKLSDATIFLIRYYQRLACSLESTNQFFASTDEIEAAKKDNEPPFRPMKDIDLFRYVIGEDADAAFELVFSEDIDKMASAFSLLKNSKSKKAVISFIKEQLANICFHSLYICAEAGSKMPESLEYKCDLLHVILCFESPDDCEELLSGTSLSECLEESDEST